MISPCPTILPLGPRSLMSHERQLPSLSTQLPDFAPPGRLTSSPATPDNPSAFRHASPKRKLSDEVEDEGDSGQNLIKQHTNEAVSDSSPHSRSEHDPSARGPRLPNASLPFAQPSSHTAQPVRLPPMRTLLDSATGDGFSPGSSWTRQDEGYRHEAFGRYQQGQARASPLQPPRDPSGPRVMTSDLAQYRTGNDRQSHNTVGAPSFLRSSESWQSQQGRNAPSSESRPSYSRSHSNESVKQPGSYAWQHMTPANQFERSDATAHSDDQPPRPLFESVVSSRSNSDPMDRWREHGDSRQSLSSDTKSPKYYSETLSQYTWEIPGTSEQTGRKRRGNLPKESTAILNEWFNNHVGYPYPKEEEKQELQHKTGLTMAQISNWFINARRRRRPATGNKDEEENDTP